MSTESIREADSASEGEPAPAVSPAVPAAPAPTAATSVAPAPQAGQATGLGSPLPVQAPKPEAVGRGLLLSLAAIPLGIIAAVLIWRLGFVASISSFVIAGAAVFLYVRGAGAAPKKGIVPLVLVILVGVAPVLPGDRGL